MSFVDLTGSWGECILSLIGLIFSNYFVEEGFEIKDSQREDTPSLRVAM
jgi:hypothetical protein